MNVHNTALFVTYALNHLLFWTLLSGSVRTTVMGFLDFLQYEGAPFPRGRNITENELREGGRIIRVQA